MKVTLHDTVTGGRELSIETAKETENCLVTITEKQTDRTISISVPKNMLMGTVNALPLYEEPLFTSGA